MPVDVTKNISTEKIQREALLILYQNLNDKIDDLEPDWNSQDEDFYNLMDKVSPGFSVEHIESDNFHAGAITQMRDRMPEEFPNCAVIAYIANPQGSSDDDGELYSLTMAVEIMVKSDTEEECNSRIQKTVDAAHLVFLDNLENRTLNGLVHPLPAPQKTIGDVFPRREGSGHGKLWYWQGGRLVYNMDKFISFYQ